MSQGVFKQDFMVHCIHIKCSSVQLNQNRLKFFLGWEPSQFWLLKMALKRFLSVCGHINQPPAPDLRGICYPFSLFFCLEPVFLIKGQFFGYWNTKNRVQGQDLSQKGWKEAEEVIKWSERGTYLWFYSGNWWIQEKNKGGICLL